MSSAVGTVRRIFVTSSGAFIDEEDDELHLG